MPRQESVAIFADVASMHNRTPAQEVQGAASDAVFFGAADALIVAHRAVDDAVSLVDAVRSRVGTPILIGGYANHENISELLEHADGAIVGGAFEETAREAGVDVERVRSFMRRVRPG
jgi:predicted TIM-barrel enzyme